MGKNPPNPSPTRDEQRQFAADKFRFLRQVAYNPAYPPLASKFAIHLLPLFNLEEDGWAWAGQDWLAKDLGCTRKTINKLYALFVEHGDLTSKRGGWGKTNRYHIAIKEPTDVTAGLHQEKTTAPTDVTLGLQSDVTAGLHYSLLTIQGDATHPHLESEAATAAPDGGPSSCRRPPPRGKEGLGGCGAVGENNNAPTAQLAALRGVWVRETYAVKDGKPAVIKAQQQALAAALQNVSFDVILAAAKPYAAVFDPENNGRRFLTPLEDWLAAKGWEKPLPKRSKADGHANGNWHRRKPKSSGNAYYKKAGFERGADGTMHEIKGRTH